MGKGRPAEWPISASGMFSFVLGSVRVTLRLRVIFSANKNRYFLFDELFCYFCLVWPPRGRRPVEKSLKREFDVFCDTDRRQPSRFSLSWSNDAGIGRGSEWKTWLPIVSCNYCALILYSDRVEPRWAVLSGEESESTNEFPHRRFVVTNRDRIGKLKQLFAGFLSSSFLSGSISHCSIQFWRMRTEKHFK